VQTGRLSLLTTAMVFPLVCSTGGALLLTHTHALANIKEQLLIELSHNPLAIFGVIAGWARWLELRLDGTGKPAASARIPSSGCQQSVAAIIASDPHAPK
jgi:putative copper resistance protein D